MNVSSSMVYVIDDDAELRESLCALMCSFGAAVTAFASAEEFLGGLSPMARGVVVTDLRMPGMSGIELQQELARRNSHLPIIILTAYARTSVTVQAIQGGAVTMLDKPYHDDELWQAIRIAQQREQTAWLARQRRQEIEGRISSLSAEERQVAELVVQGMPNKNIASTLDIGIRTVEKRRRAILAKLKIDSVAALVELFVAVRDTK